MNLNIPQYDFYKHKYGDELLIDVVPLNTGGARSLHASPRRGSASHVQPLEDLGESSAQPREHQMG